MFQLMVDRPDAQIAFQALESSLDLRQLHIALPQNRWIFGGQIGPQQIVSVAEFGILESAANWVQPHTIAQDRPNSVVVGRLASQRYR